MTDVIITVHGVGEATPGATLSCLQVTLGKGAPLTHKIVPLMVNGQTYQRLEPQAAGEPELVEVNWSDVRKPGHTIFGLLRHLPAIAIAALDLDYEWLGSTPAPPRLRTPYVAAQWLYAMLLKVFALWVGFPVLLALGYMRLDDAHAWQFGLALVALAAVMTWVVRGWGRPVLLGGAVCLVVLLSLMGLVWKGWLTKEGLTQWSTGFCGGTQLAAAVLLLALGVEVGLAVARDRTTWLHHLAHLGMNYASLILLAMLGSFLWALTLNALKHGGPYLGLTGDLVSPSWSEIFLGNIGYDLRAGEFAMLAATLGIGLLIVIGFAHYWLVLMRSSKGGESAGDVARRWYRRLLVAVPALLLIPGAALLLTCPLGPFPPDVSALVSYGLVMIYTVSAIRVAVLLPALAPRVATVLAVIGDVVFYTAKPGTTLSIRKTCNDRLHNLLLAYIGRGGIRSICVVGHSQGSVIAFEVLSRFKPPVGVSVNLVTMGSPLSTLYADFLGLQFSMRPASWFKWVNLYRTGDFIGGPMPQLGPGADISLGSGEHTGYWSDPRICPYLK